MGKTVGTLLAVGVLWLLVFGFVNSGAVRRAGVANSLADLEGEWVLDHVRGEFSPAPPARIRFSAGTEPDLVRITDGERVAEFRMQAFLWAFADGASFAPLLAPGSTVTGSMTHLCPPVPQWDHLSLYPDGAPFGSLDTSRVMTYERE